MKTLVDLFQSNPGAFDTDKHNPDHVTFGRSYLHFYDRAFEGVDIRSMVEIGVLRCGSLRLWKAWRPEAIVVGLDINPEAMALKPDNCKLVIGSQDDPAALTEVVVRCGGSISAVVDDGSHCVDHMLASFRTLWPKIQPGGCYAMEDMRCTYCTLDENWPGMRLNKTLPGNRRERMDEVLLSLVNEMDHQRGDVASILIGPMQIVFYKV